MSLPQLNNEVLENVAQKHGARLPKVGRLKLNEMHVQTLPTFQGHVFTKPDKETPTEEPEPVVSCELFPFGSGMNPREDSFMRNREHAVLRVNHALGEIFESKFFADEFCKEYGLDAGAELNKMVDQFRQKAVETHAMQDICSHTSKYPGLPLSKKHLKATSERKLIDGKKVATRDLLNKAINSLKLSL